MTPEQIKELEKIAYKSQTIHKLMQLRRDAISRGTSEAEVDAMWTSEAVMVLAKRTVTLQEIAEEAVRNMPPPRFVIKSEGFVSDAAMAAMRQAEIDHPATEHTNAGGWCRHCGSGNDVLGYRHLLACKHGKKADGR